MNTRQLRSPSWIGAVVLLLAAGSAVAGDFNGDGFTDLAVGAFLEDVGSVENSGAVNVVRGSTNGPTTVNNQIWHQDANLEDVCEEDDYFGSALAVGDFDGDGFFDLAVGVHEENVGSAVNAGAVNVLYGTISGLSASGDQLWTQDNATGSSSAEVWDHFGDALAVGDFDGDGYDDLAIGAPYEDIGAINETGAVVVLFGSATGLNDQGSEWWITTYLDDTHLRADSYFGRAIAAGDFDGDGYDDLAIGAPYYPTDGYHEAGAVFIAHGCANGLYNRPGYDIWHQSRLLNQVEDYDGFGRSLAAADFDGDGYDDLVIGVPGEAVGTVDAAGMIHVVFGTSSGLSTNGERWFNQDSFASNSPAEERDRFGSTLTTGDFNGDGHHDLVIGVAGEDWGSTEGAGMIHVLDGSATGIGDGDVEWLTEDRLIPGSSMEVEEWFGSGLAAGDFDGDGFDDLAIGAPGEDLWDGGDLRLDAGRVFLLHGTEIGLLLFNEMIDQCSGLLGGCEAGDAFGAELAAAPNKLRIFADGFESGGIGAWAGP